MELLVLFFCEGGGLTKSSAHMYFLFPLKAIKILTVEYCLLLERLLEKRLLAYCEINPLSPDSIDDILFLTKKRFFRKNL